MMIKRIISKIWGSPGSIIILISVVGYFMGCSPIPRHKTLSFFFDGVPNPADTQNLSKTDSARLNSKFNGGAPIPNREEISKLVYHLPYKEQQCSACHDQGGMKVKNNGKAALCIQCHEDFGHKFKVLHGPVGGGYCTSCHAPHLSENRFLLKRNGQELCLYCHASAQIMKVEVHREIGDANCTECHNPHGGDDRTFMK